jgi:acyl carrier protein
VALRKVYDLKIESVTEEVKQHFMNVRSLAQFIRSQQAG